MISFNFNYIVTLFTFEILTEKKFFRIVVCYVYIFMCTRVTEIYFYIDIIHTHSTLTHRRRRRLVRYINIPQDKSGNVKDI